MNILETFFFMFEADTTAVKKGVEEGRNLSKQLESSLENADKQTKALAQSFLGLATNIGKAAVAVVAFSAIKKTIGDTADHTAQLALQARALGVSSEALSTWQHAVVSAGGSAEDASMTIGGLIKRVRELSLVGGQSFAFMQLGLSKQDMEASIKDPTIALVKLSETFSKLNTQQRLYLGEKLGLDATTITLLGKGREELELYLKRQRELGVVTEEQAQTAAAWKMQVKELGLVYETVRRELTSDFLPALTWLMSKIENTILFFREHKTFALAFFGAIATMLAVTYTPAVVRAAIATWALIGPYVAVAAAIALVAAGIALVVDDIWAFAHGQDSVLGRAIAKWPLLGEIVKVVAETVRKAIGAIPDTINDLLVIIKAAFDYLAYLLEFVVSIFTMGPQKALDQFTQRTTKIFDDLKHQFSGLQQIATEVMKMITDPVNTFSKAWETAKENVKSLFDVIKSGPRGIIEWIGKKLGIDMSESPQAAILGHPEQSGGRAADAATSASGRAIAAKLQAMGWTRQQAAGIAGSFLQESGGQADARNPSSGAYGLGQWLGSRKKDFEQWSGKSLEGSSLDDQLQFFQFEVTKGKEKRAGDLLRGAQTAADAARIHSQYYERPGAAEANIARRQMLAENIAAGQGQIATASAAATNAMTASSITNSTSQSSRTLSVKTGPVTVQTQATDGNAVGRDLGRGLQQHFQGAIDAFDDGVAA